MHMSMLDLHIIKKNRIDRIDLIEKITEFTCADTVLTPTELRSRTLTLFIVIPPFRQSILSLPDIHGHCNTIFLLVKKK